MEEKFVPAYTKFGRWIFCNKTMNMKETELWFQSESANEQTTIIPYHCEACPDWMRNLYVRYKLLERFSPSVKELNEKS